MRLSGTFGGQQELFESNDNLNQQQNIAESETNRFTLKDAENESLRTSENDQGEEEVKSNQIAVEKDPKHVLEERLTSREDQEIVSQGS